MPFRAIAITRRGPTDRRRISGSATDAPVAEIALLIRVGTLVRITLVPKPNCPRSFLPKAQTSPCSVSTKVWASPAPAWITLLVALVKLSVSALGTLVRWTPPRPSWP